MEYGGATVVVGDDNRFSFWWSVEVPTLLGMEEAGLGVVITEVIVTVLSTK